MKELKTIMIAAMAVGLVACTEKKETVRMGEPISVVTEIASPESEQQGRTYVGIVEEESSTSISFTGSGTLMRVYVEEGQAVRAGQLIAELDKTQARNMLAAAESQMKQAKDALVRISSSSTSCRRRASTRLWISRCDRCRSACARWDMTSNSPTPHVRG